MDSRRLQNLDPAGRYLFRMLETGYLIPEFIRSEWILTEPSLQSRHLDNAQKIHDDIRALKKAQGVSSKAAECLEAEVIRKEAERDKLHIRLFEGVVAKNANEIENLKKEWIRQVNEKDANIKAIRRKLDVEIERSRNCDKVLPGAVAILLREALGQLVEKTRLVAELETRVTTITNNLKEKDLEMERRFGEKDLLIEFGLTKAEAYRQQLEDAQRECDSLRLKAQQMKDFEAFRDAGITTQTNLRPNFPHGEQNVDWNRSLKLEVNSDAGHTRDAPDLQTKQPGTKKRSRDEVVEGGALNVSVRPHEDKESTLGQEKRTRRKVYRYGEAV